jgi:hypothetical protein
MSNTYFILLNLDNPIAKANFEASGRITSSIFSNAVSNKEFLTKYIDGTAKYLPFVPNPDTDIVSPSLFNMSITNSYSIEYNAEICRYLYFPKKPSRLSCIYAFKDYKDCEKAINLYRWSAGNIKQFQLEESPLNRVHRANMELISLVRGLVYTVSLNGIEQDKLWRHYWNGSGDFKIQIDNPLLLNEYASGEIWEYLIEGSLTCVE